MAIRIPLTLSTQVQQNTNVSRFMLDVSKIRGLVEYKNGLVQVTFELDNGTVQVSIVEESFEEISQVIIDSDYNEAAQSVLS